GDVVFVELPELGSAVERGGTLGEVESTKSVSQIYAPLSGTVVEVNEQLRQTPEDVNGEPYGKGWLAVIEPSDRGEAAGLLDPAGYRAITEP
ncbi:MAG: glycine cleavage system protein H, partial [Acidimicrobiales bacterium]